MKKSISIVAVIVCFSTVDTYAQSAFTPATVETVVSIQPKDGIPLEFNTTEELNQVKAERILELKKLIVEFQNDRDNANFYRQELWRIENATVKTN